ncbi:major capsid protein [Escherichia phage ECO319P1]|nr:major capsid protein [Escherichia phage ECO319P1]
MATLVSYDLNGKKLSFANWISNLSPTDTPFVSMTGKESIAQTLFQWQTDSLAAVVDNAVVEGSTAADGALASTTTLNNYTQILRKVLKVSDTANALANYGRGRELQYQMEKAGKELKRDLELILLSAQEKDAGDASTKPRLTGGFESLVAGLDEPDEDTGAVVHKGIAGDEPVESDIWGLTYNLYLSGSHADIIMFHPKHASFFSSLMEVGVGDRVKMFDGKDTKFNAYVTEVIDPLGQRYRLIPNRWMPQDAIYFFRAKDWTQMVLRSPERVKLAKDGSYEKWMIEMEVGLRHANPFASGILKMGVTPPKPPVESVAIAGGTEQFVKVGETIALSVTVSPEDADQTVTVTSDNESIAKGA